LLKTKRPPRLAASLIFSHSLETFSLEFHCDSPSSYLNKADHPCGLFIKGDFSLGQIWRSDERRKYLVPSA
jgi:hypothetical protein